MTKKELLHKTTNQANSIGGLMMQLEKNLLSVTQITFRKRDLTLLGLYSLSLILNRVKGILYCANRHCEEFLLETGKKKIEDGNKRK
jgi:hypothetical protein